jgi:hypothetical protein
MALSGLEMQQPDSEEVMLVVHHRIYRARKNGMGIRRR